MNNIREAHLPEFPELPAMHLQIRKEVANFCVLSIDLSVAGENSIATKENMAWLLAQVGTFPITIIEKKEKTSSGGMHG